MLPCRGQDAPQRALAKSLRPPQSGVNYIDAMLSRAIVVAALVSLQTLPAPFETPWFRKSTRVVPMPDGRQLKTPSGFTVNVFADNLQFARFMALAPNGDVFLAEPVRGAGVITVLRDADHDGVAETRETFATGLNRPFGLAFWKNHLYVGNNDSVVRCTYTSGQTRATGDAQTIAALPPRDHALDLGQRARSPRRRSRARLHHVGARRQFLRLTVLVPWETSRSDREPTASRSCREGDRPRRAADVTCRRARIDLLYGHAVPVRVPQQRVRRAARIDQPLEVVGLLGGARAVPKRQAGRTARRFPD